MLTIIERLTWRDALFAVKTFAAAMLALYIAFRLNLSQPSWSLTTVYIVSQPLAGMVLAKSLYRVLGTLIGATMSVVLVALFADSREFFCLALALWIGLGVFVTIYLRDAPQAYVGMLAGYSAAIIGLPAALAPETAFNLAIARCLEIMLGIACGALVHHVVLPQRAGDALRAALGAALPNMARWTGDALRGQQSEVRGLEDRRRIISTVMALHGLRGFANLDTPAIRTLDSVVRHLEGKLLSLLALLLSVYDRLAILRRSDPARLAALQGVLDDVAAHFVATSTATTPAQASAEAGSEARLAERLMAHLPSLQMLRSDPNGFLVRSILLRLTDLLGMWREAVWLRTHVATGEKPPTDDPAPAFHPYRDVGFAMLGGAVTVATVLIACAFWIATAWSNGPTAVTFAGIMCAIMGARDDPRTAANQFLLMGVVGGVIAGLYLFLVLPTLSTFPALVIALAPLLLACGLFMKDPATLSLVMPVIFVGSGLLGISNAMVYDLGEFLNNFSGYVVGIWIGALSLGLLRPLGAEWAVQRLIRGVMGDLAATTHAATLERRTAFESRMFDRINALFMRLDPTVDEQRALMQGGLASLRIGLNSLALGTFRAGLGAAAMVRIDDAHAALGQYFAAAAAERRGATPLPVLSSSRNAIMRLIDDATSDTDTQLLTRIAEALYNIEATLRLHADFFGLAVSATDAGVIQAETA
jgi:uncharacterized membrane protein YccC